MKRYFISVGTAGSAVEKSAASSATVDHVSPKESDVRADAVSSSKKLKSSESVAGDSDSSDSDVS